MTVPSYKIHNATVSKMRNHLPFSKWRAKCSCGFEKTNISGRAMADLEANIHVKTEVEMEKYRAQAAQMKVSKSKTPTTSARNNSTVGDLATMLDNVTRVITDTKVEARNVFEDADRVLTDEDRALSPTEYEFYVVRKARAEGALEIIEGIEQGFKS